jgi:hypothetical protein
VPAETVTGPAKSLPADARVSTPAPSFSMPDEPLIGTETVALWFAITCGPSSVRKSPGVCA